MATDFDPNNDPGYKRPTAWRKMKEAIGPTGDLRAALEALERTPGCPRFVLLRIIENYLRLSNEERMLLLFSNAAVTISDPATGKSVTVETGKPRRPRRPGDQPPKGETVAQAWKRLAPPGWPLPPNLPPGATIRATKAEDGRPPIIYAGPGGKPEDHDVICPHCGARFVRTGSFGNHLTRAHGWTYSRANGRQLRHNAATRIRRDYGLDAARLVLGHPVHERAGAGSILPTARRPRRTHDVTDARPQGACGGDARAGEGRVLKSRRPCRNKEGRPRGRPS